MDQSSGICRCNKLTTLGKVVFEALFFRKCAVHRVTSEITLMCLKLKNTPGVCCQNPFRPVAQSFVRFGVLSWLLR